MSSLPRGQYHEDDEQDFNHTHLLGTTGIFGELNVSSDDSASDNSDGARENKELLGFGSLFASVGMMFCNAVGSIRVSLLIHEKLILSVLGAPSSFFNANPDGRIVNHFTADMDKIDQTLVISKSMMKI